MWFERLAHNPNFEEPERFNRVVLKEALYAVARPSCGHFSGAVPSDKGGYQRSPNARPCLYPVMFYDLQRITPHVWVHPPSPDATEVQAAVGVVVGEGETLLVDAGNGPKLARHIQEQLETLGAPPVRRVIYTHHHWDHVFGACIYRAPALAHARCREALSEAAQSPWGPELLEREVALNSKLAESYGAMGRAVDDWEAFEIVVPEAIAAERATIHVDDIRLEVRHVGGRHTADSVVVGLPGEGVLFLGDCFYPPPLHLRTEDDTFDITMLASLVEPTYRFYVGGHEEVATFEELTEWLGRDGS